VLRDFIRFYGACLALALQGKLTLAFSVAGAIAVCASVGVWTLSPAPTIEHFATTDLPGIVFVAVLVPAILFGLILAPFQLHREGERARAALEARLRPKLEFTLPKSGAISATIGGHTSETVAGTRQTIIRNWLSDVVCLHCKNVGEVTVHHARVRVMRVRRQSDDGSGVAIELDEALELPWNKEDLGHSFSVDIAPNETRRIWIGRVTEKGCFWALRDLKSLPAEHQQVFGPPGRYRIVLQVDSDDAVPVQALLDVEAAAGAPPKQAGLWRGEVSVALVAQGSPRLEVPDDIGDPPGPPAEPVSS
jgi:hypothetical protein